jgi:two-component system phosphate regulon sensor histidine kinase PhoR
MQFRGLSEVTRLVTFGDIDRKFGQLTLQIKLYNALNDVDRNEKDAKAVAAKVAEIGALELDISKSLIQASANLVIIEQSSKAGVIYSSLILDESEITQGSEADLGTVDFDQWIAEYVEMFKEGKLAIKHIDLICKFDSIGIIKTSKYHVRIIINNLIANAINYTPQNGQITLMVTAKIEAGVKSVVFIVSDSGEGISEDNIGKIRKKFKQCTVDQRFDRLSSSETKGSGVGLVNVLSCVQTLKGEIGVKSRGIGKGSTFVVTLPLVD